MSALELYRNPLVVGAAKALELTSEQVQVICEHIAPKCSAPEVALFLHQAKRAGLDPFSRQIYCVKYKDDAPASIITSIDGFRIIAERSGKYAGQTPAQWCGLDGEWVDVWLDKEPPAAAKVGVFRSDFREPVYAVARYASYCSTFWDKEKKQHRPTQIWAKMPDLMLAKVAEALALRKAFPNDMSGLCTDDEMDQARVVVDFSSTSNVETVEGKIEEPNEQQGRTPRETSPELAALKDRLKGLMAKVEGHTLTDPKTGEVKPDLVANVRATEARIQVMMTDHPDLCPLRSNGVPNLGAADSGQLFRICRLYEELAESQAVSFGGAA